MLRYDKQHSKNRLSENPYKHPFSLAFQRLGLTFRNHHDQDFL